MGFEGFRRVIGVFRHRDYARYTAGNSLSLIGLWMQRIGVGWLTWELTQSPTWLGIIAMTEFFPVVFLGPLGGVLADRFDRTSNMIFFQSIAMVASLVLCLVTAFGLINIWLLAGLTLIVGIAAGLNSASRLALPPSLVPASDLTTAIAMNSMVFNTARFIGPAIAGVVIKLWGVEVAFAGNAASYLTLIWALSSIRRSLSNGRGDTKDRQNVVTEMREGFSFVAAHRGAMVVLAMMLGTALLIRPVVQLLPGISDVIFAAGVDGFAALTATIGGGAILGGYWMAQRRVTNTFDVGLIGILVSAATILGLLNVASLQAALPLTLILGAGMVVTGVGMQTTLQFAIPEKFRGRVLSLYGVCFMGGPALGTLVMGALAEVFGLRLPIMSGALIVLVLWIIFWIKRRAITNALDEISTSG